MPVPGAAETGRSTCTRRDGIRSPKTTRSGAGGGATALQRLQWSQACPGTRPDGRVPGEPGTASCRQMTEKGSTLATSMYRDMLNGLPVEVEHILGDLTRRARALGIDTPLLDAATAKLRVYQNRLGSHG